MGDDDFQPRGDFRVVEALIERLGHGRLEPLGGVGQSSTDDYSLGVIGEDGGLQQLAHVVSEFVEYSHSLKVALLGLLGELKARQGGLPLEKQAAGVVLIVRAEIGHTTQFSRCVVGSAVDFVVDDDASAESCPEVDTHEVVELTPLAIIFLAQGEAVDIIVDPGLNAKATFYDFLEVDLFPCGNKMLLDNQILTR